MFQSPEGSYDLNSNDPDPMPHPDEENGNHHGTRCAGEIAAVPNNSFCAVGVAYGSRIAGNTLLLSLGSSWAQWSFSTFSILKFLFHTLNVCSLKEEGVRA